MTSDIKSIIARLEKDATGWGLTFDATQSARTTATLEREAAAMLRSQQEEIARLTRWCEYHSIRAEKAAAAAAPDYSQRQALIAAEVDGYKRGYADGKAAVAPDARLWPFIEAIAAGRELTFQDMADAAQMVKERRRAIAEQGKQ